jgi:FKBP-type peptidyl-prolyl cis-trans isomerase (trigger factor)
MASSKTTKTATPKTTETKPTSTLTRKDDGSLEFHIVIPQDQIKKTWEEVMTQVVASAKIAGFRPGKAPRKVVEESADRTKVREEVLQKLIPQLYIEAVQKEMVRPIVNPKIHVDKIDDESDWEFTATTCEMPKVELGKYKEAVQKITAKSKIAVPGKEEVKPNLDELVKAVVDNVKVTIPHLLVEYEADRLLSQTLDEIKRLGLSLDQYLASTNKTPDELRKEYEARAINDMTVEFSLAQIADSEKITVGDEELNDAIQKAKDPQERAHMEANKYLLASILRQQKTLDFLQNL